MTKVEYCLKLNTKVYIDKPVWVIRMLQARFCEVEHVVIVSYSGKDNESS